MIGFLKSILKKNKFIFYNVHFLKTKYTIWRSKEIIIIHTPGHVGSSTVYNSLRGNTPPSSALFDIHSLHQKWNNKSSIPSLSARHVIQEAIADSTKKLLRDKKIKLICLIRDPVSRALSGYFQGFKIWNKEKSLSDIEIFEKEFDVIYSKITGPEFRSSFLSETVTYQANWIEEEVRPFFDISIEKDLLETHVDYHIYKKGNIELLVLKLEKLNLSFENVIEKFLGLKIKLITTNSHEGREGANFKFYTFFKNKFKLPENILDEIYAKPFIKKFYTSGEIEQFKNNWKA
ncbi:MAG: hypothetical protein K2X86_03790 [Cytophagaceae bacterium]|nr:hypothetical protein [Cytophagaceae bacterium]